MEIESSFNFNHLKDIFQNCKHQNINPKMGFQYLIVSKYSKDISGE